MRQNDLFSFFFIVQSYEATVLFFFLPDSRFNSLKKRFGEFKNRVGQSTKYSRFFDHRRSQTRFLIFAFLDLLDGVQYRLYLLNANLLNHVFFDFASFIFSSKAKTLTAVVSASTRLSVILSTSCSKFDSSRQSLRLLKSFSY